MLFNILSTQNSIKRAKAVRWRVVSAATKLTEQYRVCDDHEVLVEASRIRCDFSSINKTNSTGPLSSTCSQIPIEQLIKPLALVCEAVRRERGFRPYQVQMFGALALAERLIIDMKTGEGKSIVAVMGAYLLSLTGECVHVATTNDYLASRDAENARSILSRVGTTVGKVTGNDAPDLNRQAYTFDITYGPGYQFGFDYLKDQAVLRSSQTGKLGQKWVNRLNGKEGEVLIQSRRPGFAIVDEADSVLIDEATTPMILSASDSAKVDPAPFGYAQELAKCLERDRDYQIEGRRIEWIESGKSKLQSFFRKRLSGGHLVRPWQVYVENSLLALHCYHRNDHYVVVDGEIRIVDNLTGRIFSDRSWQNGLHQAIECKEQVALTAGRSVLARVTRQRFFQRYIAVSGLTGTIGDLENELKFSYGAGSEIVPSHLVCQRVQLPTRAFANWEAKLKAIAEETIKFHAKRRPVLIGTRNIARSIEVCDELRKHNIDAVLLNGLQDQEEAEVISHAGRPGAVTVATNMAGRGTDIRLDEISKQAGGLHVIGTEPHDSIRIDLQLFGRSARQGDPGSARLFTCCEDSLFDNVSERSRSRALRDTGKSGEIRTSLASQIFVLQQRNEWKSQAIREKLFFSDRWLDTVKEGCESFS